MTPKRGTGHRLKGYHKLLEEMGELTQALTKLAAFTEAPTTMEERKKLRAAEQNLLEELADVRAAIIYFTSTNRKRPSVKRVRAKLKRWRTHGLVGIPEWRKSDDRTFTSPD